MVQDAYYITCFIITFFPTSQMPTLHEGDLKKPVVLDSSVFITYVMFLSGVSFSSFLAFQIYTDFDEIRQEIEAETERISGTNKVPGFLWDTNKTMKHLKKLHDSCCADVLYMFFSGHQQ